MQSWQLLQALAPGTTLSGARLAESAGVSRAAVWKQIEALRARGVPVQADSAGYRLPWPIQLLDETVIGAAMEARVRVRLGALEVHWELDSTSTELQRRGAAAADLSVVLAETQSAGRGRRGRAWLSPPGMNIHLSLCKRFDAAVAGLSGLSLALGVMLLHALQRLKITGVGLKWPNDVLAEDGKLAGILVEISGDFQGPCTAVIGIGLNLRLTDAMRQQAGQPISDLAALCGGHAPDRNLVAAALIESLVDGLANFECHGFAAFDEDYAFHDLLLGQPLQLSGAVGDMLATGLGVDVRGALRVRMANGSECSIDSADVTVRRQ